MNTTIKPKSNALIKALEANKQRAVSAYDPTVAQCKEQAHRAFVYVLNTYMKDSDRERFQKYNAHLTAAAPFFEFVKHYVKGVKIQERHLRDMFGHSNWDSFKPSVKRRLMLGVTLDQQEREQALQEVQAVFDTQFKIAGSLSDEDFMRFEEMAEEQVNFPLDRIDSHILPDYEKRESEAMRASEIYRYLLPKSHGTLTFTPQQLANLLPALGYEYFERKVRGKQVKFYYVKLVR